METIKEKENKILSFYYQKDKTKFQVNIITKENNNFYFLIINKENEYDKYELNLSLSDLINKSDFFKLCKNSEDFINYINQIFDNKNFFLEKDINSEEKLIMKWKYNTLFKVEEIIFYLKKIKISIDNKIDLFKKDLDNMKNEINQIKIDELNKIKEKINSLENKIDELQKNYKNDIKIEIEKYFKDLKKKENIFEQESLICTNEKEINFIYKFINMIRPNSRLKLIYRASVDGQMGKDFHSKCDNIFPTVSLFKNEIGNKFGGYTESNWNITTYGADGKAFIFSLNKEKYYKVNNNPNYSICSEQKRGPNFDGLWVREPFFNKGNFWETEGDHKCFPKISTYEMSGKESGDVLLELEVFQVI